MVVGGVSVAVVAVGETFLLGVGDGFGEGGGVNVLSLGMGFL